MRRYLRSILAILDGAPPPSRPRRAAQRGQSLVELTLMMPILMIMLLGLVEVGWLASNFMILLDVTREAGRFGAGGDPMGWVIGDEYNLERMDCDTIEGGSYVDAPDNNTWLPVLDPEHLPGFYFDGGEWDIDYYDGVACGLVANMPPLIFNPFQDDVAISVFSYLVGDFGSGYEVLITGRYPSRTNECQTETYDPFDWNHNGTADPNEDNTRYDATNENVRGYILTGRHEVSDSPGCLGSEFSTQEVQDMLNGASALENEFSPNNGLLLVEVYWHHSQLLGLRWFTMFGDNFELHVWSIFPQSASEPTATPLGG
ncbi:MAG: pilus assembly protein [Anaerolineae bacterium]|nr:pilus assembly protein [Anaerolineae bacterium]